MKPTSRRLFTQGTAATGLACSLIPGRVIGANNRVNIGVIGCGGKGRGHVNSFDRLADVSVVAVSDPDTTRMNQAAKDRSGVAMHQDLRNLLEMKDLDAVVIATPNHWHSLAAIMACQAGKHVYVEKPVSHSIHEGRKMVEAARKYNRIVQAGTQQRSCPAVQECAADVQAGKYGKVLWVHSMKLGARSPIGKVSAPVPVPGNIDYNLWAGPAPMTPVHRKKFHYDWHWQWNWGDGEMGNWGVHYLDDLRHILGWNDVPTRVVSAGARWWDDDGQTPNMHLALMEHKGVAVVVDIRNMQDFATGRKQGAVYLKSTGGNYIMCEKGYIKISRGGGKAYAHDGTTIKQYKGTGGRGHDANFIEAIRQGNNKSLACEIEVGHQSTVMCHLANIGWRVGKATSMDRARGAFKGHEDAANTLESILAQLDGTVDFKQQPIILGPKLTYDNRTERFVGSSSSAANQYVKLPSRKPFAVPDKV